MLFRYTSTPTSALTFCWLITSNCRSALSHSPANRSNSKREVRPRTSAGLLLTWPVSSWIADCNSPLANSSSAFFITPLQHNNPLHYSPSPPDPPPPPPPPPSPVLTHAPKFKTQASFCPPGRAQMS